MTHWIVDAVSGMGPIGVALLMFVENLFPPIPSEMVVPLAGYLTVKGKMSIFGVIVAAVLGSVAGQLLLYALARRMGEAKFRDWVGRHGRWVTLTPGEVDRTAKWLHDKGSWTVAVGRVIPGVRSLISIPAGLSGMPLAPFLAYTIAGTTVWTVALAYAGRFLGSRFESIDRYLGPVAWIVVGLAVALYLYRVVTHKGAEDGKPVKSGPSSPGQTSQSRL